MIELRHLRYFVAVAEELSFVSAAARVHIDQAPLSRAVRDLEDELSVQLLVRAPRRLQLTPAGVRLLEDARKLFIRFERTKRAVRQTHSLYRAPLCIGVADGIAQPKLSECFNRWRDVAPEVPLELVEMRARELTVALRNEEVDIGFSFGVPDDEAIAQTQVSAAHTCDHPAKASLRYLDIACSGSNHCDRCRVGGSKAVTGLARSVSC